MKKKSNLIIIIISVIAMISVFFLYSKPKDVNHLQSTTVRDCVSLSQEIRINEKTNECFSKLSTDEFISLMSNEEDMKLYNDVKAFYDKRTESQKAEDAKKTEDYVNEVIKNLESNPNAYKK